MSGLCSSPVFGVDYANSTVTAPAPAGFQSRLSTTPMAEIGRVVAELLVGDDVHGKVVRISAGHPTYEDLALLIEKVTGKPVKRVVRPEADIEAAAGRKEFPALFAIVPGTRQPG